MTTDPTKKAATSRWSWQLAIPALILFALSVGTLAWLFNRSSANTTSTEVTLPSTHPVFGAFHETSAIDTVDMPVNRDPTGSSLPNHPVYLDLGPRLLEWSGGDLRPSNPIGYLYSCDPMVMRTTMNTSNVWSFAPCNKSRLADVTVADLGAVFCAAGENEKGRTTFGTNWSKARRGENAVLVREGQVILARHSAQPSTIYEKGVNP
jgi:hypothetical protein